MEEALLPRGPRSFEGYRLLKEYFACPQRFLFFELSGLGLRRSAMRGRSDQLDDYHYRTSHRRAKAR